MTPSRQRPRHRYHRSFLDAMAEFRAEGRGGPGDHSMIGEQLRTFGEEWQNEAGFQRFLAKLAADADPATPRPDDRVPCTTHWWVEDDEFLARIALRHRLNRYLFVVGGHIGYDVRPPARRRGHATAMLRAALPVAHALGIDPALITCDIDNVASRKTIEVNGGRFDDERQGKLRFWVPTS